ncbi:putative lipoprotein with DUF1672 [Staphylococcus aureus]|uniref:Putative lipoprotein with DUF1672 n=1 Tax=Staphylococcus aureus TaxID=1280 RepID=A0A2X2JW14_STAAU|nr:putative lipoprotein with DUF1672 [Staphylococcus aureus]
MKKFIGSVLATTLILGGCSTMEMNQVKTRIQKQNQYRRNGSFKYVGQASNACRKDAIEFAKSIKIKLPNEANNFYG